jgi:hypothetical protein
MNAILSNTDAGISKHAEETFTCQRWPRVFFEEGSKHVRNNDTCTSARTAVYSRTMESSSAPLFRTSARVVHDYAQKKEAISSFETLVYITICLAESPRRRVTLSMPL